MLTKRKILAILQKQSIRTTGEHQDVFNFAYHFINGMEDSSIDILIRQYNRRK